MTDAKDTINTTVNGNDVVLFMKGTKAMPQCGFSSRVAGVLNYMGVEFQDVNVLEDDGIRQGIKEYSDWPTIPQLYVKGEFVGGHHYRDDAVGRAGHDVREKRRGLRQGCGRENSRSQRVGG